MAVDEHLTYKDLVCEALVREELVDEKLVREEIVHDAAYLVDNYLHGR